MVVWEVEAPGSPSLAWIFYISSKPVTNADISRFTAPITLSAVSSSSRDSGAKRPKSSRPSRTAASTSIVGCQEISFLHLHLH